MKPIHPATKNGIFSPAERCGVIAFALAILLGAVDLRLATVPLTLLVMMCVVAPFLPRAGFFFPVISHGTTGENRVAITFDDGPDPATTPRLLDLLEKYRVPATFFVTGRRAAVYPNLIRAIIDRGHEIGNHSFHHNKYRMFWQPGLLDHEIVATQRALAPLGIVPLAFRPPIGITTPAMGKILTARNLFAVNFSCRAFDGGNRRIGHLSRKILTAVQPDDIVLLHDSRPDTNRSIEPWLNEVEAILKGLSDKGLSAVPLSRLIGRPVMRRKDERIF
ncbi:polysaccharide deacetylase family protein [uncultured Desulfosarcina sp.]|uniref:polysaccharide deacetylase family protein n=1 Tax=uncultured Desulfosarcina sp. TaxID=218289 RepID=UPI0029C76AF0|nr:polysaccharide deacetylase family protein [uncultured Desulfosarcina sp.]